MKFAKQIMILNQESYNKTKKEFKEDTGEDLTFEGYVNMELGTLFDNDREIVDIKPNEGATIFVITFLIKMDK